MASWRLVQVDGDAKDGFSDEDLGSIYAAVALGGRKKLADMIWRQIIQERSRPPKREAGVGRGS